MPNLIQGQGTHSIPVFENTIITFTGSVTGQFTANSGIDIRNNVATWETITLPTIIRKRGYVRLTALSDSEYSVNTNPSQKDIDSFKASNGYLQYLTTSQSTHPDITGVVAGTENGRMMLPSGDIGIVPVLDAQARLLYSQMIVPSWPMQSGNKTAWTAAVGAGSGKVAVVGHSIIAGNNQNFYGATVYNAIKRVLGAAFPATTLDFRNYGIGGTRADQFTTGGNPNTTITAAAATQYREFWEADSGSLTTNGSWLSKVQTYAPDLVFIQFDLNETNYSTFGNSLVSMLTGMAGWAKPPTIVLGTSHVGLTNGPVTPGLVRQCHRVTRAIAKRFRCYLYDAGRMYDLLTGQPDPVYIVPVVSGEMALLGQVPNNGNVPTSLIDNIVGTAFSPTGATIRNVTGGQPFRFNRRVATVDGANQQAFTLSATTGVASLFYRVQPNDANYATGTGGQYEIRVSDNGTNTVMQAYYWPAGSAVAISGATFNFATRIGTNTKFQIRVEYRGCEHTVKVFNPTSGTYQEFTFFDHQNLEPGYNGVGIAGTGAGFIDVGSLASGVSAGIVFEQWSAASGGFRVFTDAELVGEASSVWNNSFNGAGGNGINHLTNFGQKVIYDYPLIDCIKALQY